MPFDSTTVADIWCCSQCRSKLRVFDAQVICVNAECRLSFPLLDNIPRMVVGDARQLDPEDWNKQLSNSDEADASAAS